MNGIKLFSCSLIFWKKARVFSLMASLKSESKDILLKCSIVRWNTLRANSNLASFRLERLARKKRSSLFDRLLSDKEKKFHNIDNSSQCYKTFFYSSLIYWNKLECCLSGAAFQVSFNVGK